MLPSSIAWLPSRIPVPSRYVMILHDDSSHPLSVQWFSGSIGSDRDSTPC